jgi:hypothetical protein
MRKRVVLFAAHVSGVVLRVGTARERDYYVALAARVSRTYPHRSPIGTHSWYVHTGRVSR